MYLFFLSLSLAGKLLNKNPSLTYINLMYVNILQYSPSYKVTPTKGQSDVRCY